MQNGLFNVNSEKSGEELTEGLPVSKVLCQILHRRLKVRRSTICRMDYLM